jgi:hypothetical protein
MKRKISNLHELIIELGGYENLGNDFESFCKIVHDLDKSLYEYQDRAIEKAPEVNWFLIGLTLSYLSGIGRCLQHYKPADKSLVENTYTTEYGRPTCLMDSLWWYCKRAVNLCEMIEQTLFDVDMLVCYHAENKQFLKYNVKLDANFKKTIINIRKFFKGMKRFKIGISAKLIKPKIEMEQEA